MKFEKSQAAIERLTPEQRRITQQDGTERPFTGEYNDNKEAGIYVDVVSGEPLFASTDKFESGTGWPSFYAPIEGHVGTSTDRSFFMVRTEVHCSRCGGHLGHVFPDGFGTPTGDRYCMNSLSLSFSPES